MSGIDLTAAHRALNVFNNFLQENHKISISEKEADELLIKTFKQYEKHIEKHDIHVNAACPYKMISWIAFLLAEKYKDNEKLVKIFLNAGAKVMRVLLERRAKIPNDITIKLINMCIAEIKGDDIVGIGRNGFYMSFKMLSESSILAHP